ncbi:MAG: UDP-N-acetylglucosamine 1-carboxyvinyltransferase [Lachnospiraceae bacterium]|nr:UDP-N-acetylglucosamine 1-carboxyvinyltransferase [Lachnospiraceae bacterium]
MPEIFVEGGHRLRGELYVQGSKNAVLPILAAAVLPEGETVLTRVPVIGDVAVSLEILSALGVSVSFADGRLTLCADSLCSAEVPQELGARMRSSVLFLGSLLGRRQEVRTAFPGGCAIGSRPVGLHLSVLRQLGAEIFSEGDRLCGRVEQFTGGTVTLPSPSVGATEQALLAAVSAAGETLLRGAAREPEVQILCDFLCACGAKIRGQGTGEIRVTPAPLHGCHFEIPGDRIAAGTYLAAAAATSGDVTVRGIFPAQLRSSLAVFRRLGCLVDEGEDWVRLIREGALRPVSRLETEPYPGFPTDMQPLILPLLALASGESRLWENLFENRLGLAGELNRMGADIEVHDRLAVIHGVESLAGCPVAAHDLRGGAGLLVAALAARGDSHITGRKYMERGYEEPERNLAALGAVIRCSGESGQRRGKREEARWRNSDR